MCAGAKQITSHHECEQNITSVSKMYHLGVAVLGVAVLGAAEVGVLVLGTAVLGVAVLHHAHLTQP